MLWRTHWRAPTESAGLMKGNMLEPSDRPALVQNPPPVPAMPAGLRNENADRWYLPSWGERLKLMNWRLIYFLPGVLVLPLFLLFPFAILFWWKILLIVIA